MDTLKKAKTCIVEYAPHLKLFPNPTPTLTDFPNPHISFVFWDLPKQAEFQRPRG